VSRATPTTAGPALDALGRSHPEWAPWLTPLRLTLVHAADRAYDAAVPPSPSPASPGAPLLDGSVLTLDPRVADRHVRALLDAAAAPATSAVSLAGVARSSALDAIALLDAAVPVDTARLAALADTLGADAGALTAVAALAAMPLLQACARRWAGDIAADWSAGYCPVCGAWPALAEERGLERGRRLRCGRCAADWRGAWLRCPFCATTDHASLGALVPESGHQTRKAETCAACRGYLKTVTTLTPATPAEIAALDLETVELDLAALAADYRRPPGLGCAPAARVMSRTGSRRGLRLPWRAA
jgi:FdhE protein